MAFRLVALLLMLQVARGDLPPYALEATVAAALQRSAASPLRRSTGRTREDYLANIAGVVLTMLPYQNSTGHIIDPYRGLETQYATPCYAHACATVWQAGAASPPLGSCTAALSASIQELATDTCADGHCVFFLSPVMQAWRILNASADVAAATKAEWAAGLAALNPARDYHFPTNNWGLVGAAGDLLRTNLIAQFGNSSWADAMLASQLNASTLASTWTSNGLYQDHTGVGGLNPIPYSIFPVGGYFTVLLKEGYNGTFAPLIREITRRAALTHLLMQSPWGDMPTGGRSSQVCERG